MKDNFEYFLNLILFCCFILIILFFFNSCSIFGGKKDPHYQEDTMEAQAIHKVIFECDLKKSKICKLDVVLEINRQTGFKQPVFEKDESLLDPPKVKGINK